MENDPARTATSMQEVLSLPLAQFEALTNQLFTSLVAQTPAVQPGSSITASDTVNAFAQCEVALADALNQARVHQVKQRQIEQLKEEIVDLDWKLKEICEKLKEDVGALEEIVRDGDERVKIIERTEKAAIPADYILAYALNLTTTTSAPITNTNPGPDQPAPPAFVTPYPDDAILRQGLLGRSGERLTEPRGEARVVGEPAPSPLGPARAPAPAVADQKRHPGHYRPPPSAIPDFGLDLSDD